MPYPRLEPLPVCLTIAVVVRVVHLALLAAFDPLFSHAIAVEADWVGDAERLLQRGVLLAGEGAYPRAPLYGLLLAASRLGLGEAGSVIAARVVSTVASALSVLLVTKMAGRAGGRGAAWVAGVIAAFYGPALHLGTVVGPMPLVTLALLVAGDRLLSATLAARERQRIAGLVVAGLLIGLAAAARSDVLAALAAATLWVVVSGMRGSWPGLSTTRAVLLLVIPASCVLAPIALRNAVVERDPVIVSADLAVLAFVGNDPAFEPASGRRAGEASWDRLQQAPRLLGAHRGSERQRFFARQAVRRAAGEPLAVLHRWGRKLVTLLGPRELAGHRRIDDARRHSLLLALLWPRVAGLDAPFALLGPWLVAGMILAGRTATRRGSVLVVLAGVMTAIAVVVFPTQGLRLSVAFLLLPLAATAWANVSRLPQTRLVRRMAVAAPLAAILFAAPWVGAVAPSSPAPSESSLLASALERRGRGDEAIAAWRRAVIEEPGESRPRRRLGDRLRLAGRCRDALAEYEIAVTGSGVSGDERIAALRATAVCRLALEEPEHAVEALRQAIDASPDAPHRAGGPTAYVLTDVPPLRTCVVRLELAEALERAGSRLEAAAELVTVTTDCDESERLVVQAVRRLREGRPR